MPKATGQTISKAARGTTQHHENRTLHRSRNQRLHRSADSRSQPPTAMNQHPIERQSSDTFGRNTKADLELLRRINERNNDRSEEIFALAVVTAAILCVCGIAVLIVAYAIWS